MSKKSKLIEESLRSDDKKYVKDDLYRVLENFNEGEQKFTGYYANDDNKVYSTKAWSKKLIQKKKKAQNERLTIFEQEQDEVRRKRKKKIRYVSIGFAVFIISVLGIVYAIRSTGQNQENNAPLVVKDKTTLLTKFTTTNVDSSFGNARITGSDVNMREQPNLNAAIIDFFSKEGERVLMVQPASDTLSWCKITRKEGTTGWVFSEYVKEIVVAQK